MNQIEHIKDLYIKGKKISEIAELLQVDIKTVKKYCKQDDYSDQLKPVMKQRASKLDRWKPLIDSWQEEDRRMRYKQRHTARQIHKRLKELYGEAYDCSYPVVQRYCKQKNEQKEKYYGTQELIWHKGEAQVDFGEADFIENGQKIAKKYLCCTFPYSNAGYVQVFGGESAECAVQGLLDIFHHIGGVPQRLVCDNASGIGRKIREELRISELFKRFKCHYGFELTFCNVNAGHEKGNVENKVGYIRRNFFVPITEYTDLEEYNTKLLIQSEDDFKRIHYKKNISMCELFEDEKKNLSPLPVKPFRAIRYERITTDGYGKFCLDGKHFYSSSPEYAEKEIIIEIGAHAITVYTPSGTLLTTHKRMYGTTRTDSIDFRTSVSRLFQNPGAWRNSGIREIIPPVLKDTMDKLEKQHLKEALGIMKHLCAHYSFETCIQAMTQAALNNCMDNHSAMVLAARMSSSGLTHEVSDCDLKQYDHFLTQKGEHDA
jgi:transposase